MNKKGILYALFLAAAVFLLTTCDMFGTIIGTVGGIKITTETNRSVARSVIIPAATDFAALSSNGITPHTLELYIERLNVSSNELGVLHFVGIGVGGQGQINNDGWYNLTENSTITLIDFPLAGTHDVLELGVIGARFRADAESEFTNITETVGVIEREVWLSLAYVCPARGENNRFLQWMSFHTRLPWDNPLTISKNTGEIVMSISIDITDIITEDDPGVFRFIDDWHDRITLTTRTYAR